MRRARLIEQFPGLGRSHFRLTSPIDKAYNCFAWGATDTRNRWHPEPHNTLYWPAGAPRGVGIAAFSAAYATLGFAPAEDSRLQPGVEKIALYVAPDGEVSHVARQLPSGRWTSKMGPMEDIEHDLPALEGERWGVVTVILARDIDEQVEIAL